MIKGRIGYRVTVGLVVTAILITAISVLIYFGLTQMAFNEYIKENRIQEGHNISQVLSIVYEENGWDGIEYILNEASVTGKHRRANWQHSNMLPMRTFASRSILVTDDKGNLKASSIRNVSEETLKKLWNLRVPLLVNDDTVGYVIVWTPIKDNEINLENIFRRTVFRYSFMVGLFSLFLSIIVGSMISRQLIKPIKELSNAVRAFAKGNRDISFKTNSEDELGDLGTDFNFMAEQIKISENQRKNLTADIAHELRTPISIIRGTLESIQMGVLKFTPDVLLSLQDEILRMSRLVRDLSDLSKAELGTLELNKTKIHPSKFKDSFLYFKNEADLRGIQFLIDIPEELPEIIVDEMRIIQVITNLLNNSLRYTKEGKIELIAKKSDGGVEFLIKDTGNGIKKEDIPYIFERFYRTEKSRSREFGGTGLGLSIAKGIVEAHKGRIWAESDGKTGTIFGFFIPIDVAKTL